MATVPADHVQRAGWSESRYCLARSRWLSVRLGPIHSRTRERSELVPIGACSLIDVARNVRKYYVALFPRLGGAFTGQWSAL